MLSEWQLAIERKSACTASQYYTTASPPPMEGLRNRIFNCTGIYPAARKLDLEGTACLIRTSIRVGYLANHASYTGKRSQVLSASQPTSQPLKMSDTRVVRPFGIAGPQLAHPTSGKSVAQKKKMYKKRRTRKRRSKKADRV